jgi:hypothetical protein
VSSPRNSGPKVDYKRDAVEKIVVTVSKAGQEVFRYSTGD